MIRRGGVYRLGDIEIAGAAPRIRKHAIASQIDSGRNSAEAISLAVAPDDAGDVSAMLALGLGRSPVLGGARVVANLVADAIQSAGHVRQRGMRTVDSGVDDPDRRAGSAVGRQAAVELAQQEAGVCEIDGAQVDGLERARRSAGCIIAPIAGRSVHVAPLDDLAGRDAVEANDAVGAAVSFVSGLARKVGEGHDMGAAQRLPGGAIDHRDGDASAGADGPRSHLGGGPGLAFRGASRGLPLRGLAGKTVLEHRAKPQPIVEYLGNDLELRIGRSQAEFAFGRHLNQLWAILANRVEHPHGGTACALRARLQRHGLAGGLEHGALKVRIDEALLRHHDVTRRFRGHGSLPRQIPCNGWNDSVPTDDPRRSLTVADPDSSGVRHVAMVGDIYSILVSGAQTAGRYCLIDMIVPDGGGPPPHRHDYEEMFTLLEGELEFTFRGEPRLCAPDRP